MPKYRPLTGENMARFIVLLAAAGAAAYYFLIMGSQLSESDIRKYYSTYQTHMDDGNAKALCDMLADQYQEQSTLSTTTGIVQDTNNKAQACEAYEKLFAAMRSMSEKLKMQAVINSAVTIDDIVIAPGKKQAVVTGTSDFKMGTEKLLLTRTTTTGTATFIKRYGKVQMLASESKGTMRLYGQ
jgi:hypothetical protein